MRTSSRSQTWASLAALFCLLCAPGSRARAIELRNGLLFGYDSFIDRYTIVDDDTSEVTHEYYAGLDNHLRHDSRSLKYSLRNIFRYGNQTIDEYAEGAFSAGTRRRGLVQARADLRLKAFREGSDYEFGNDYLQSNAYLSLGKEFRDEFYIVSKSRAELIDYDERTDFDYDYRYIDTGLGIELGSFFGKFASVSAAFGRRECPDTSALSYDRFLGTADGRLANGRFGFDLSVSADRRDYDGLTRSSSWNVLSGIGLTWTRSGGDSWSLRLDSELYRYDTETTTFFDNYFLRGGMRARVPASRTASVILEPRIGWLSCPSFEEERYVEGTVVLGVDLFSGGSYWLSASYEPGYRNYLLDENDIYSDFRISRLSLMGSATLAERVMLTVFVSHDPEYHSRRTDDFSMTLLSASVSLLF